MAENDENWYRYLIARSSTDGKPDPDKVQDLLSGWFVYALVSRKGDVTPDSIVHQFAKLHAGTLHWIGETRQDNILKEATKHTGIDFSHLLNKE
jgi:hypothetical protein